MKKKKANEKQKANEKKSEFKKNKNKAVPTEVQTGGKRYRRQSPYTMSHTNIAYQVTKFTIYKVLP